MQQRCAGLVRRTRAGGLQAAGADGHVARGTQQGHWGMCTFRSRCRRPAPESCRVRLHRYLIASVHPSLDVLQMRSTCAVPHSVPAQVWNTRGTQRDSGLRESRRMCSSCSSWHQNNRTSSPTVTTSSARTTTRRRKGQVVRRGLSPRSGRRYVT